MTSGASIFSYELNAAQMRILVSMLRAMLLVSLNFPYKFPRVHRWYLKDDTLKSEGFDKIYLHGGRFGSGTLQIIGKLGC